MLERFKFRAASRQSLARGRTTSGIVEDHKAPSGTISGVLSGGLKSTGKMLGDHTDLFLSLRTVLKTGTTIGLLLGVVPSKNSRDFLRRKVTRMFTKSTDRVHPEDEESSDSDTTDDSEAERIKGIRRKRYGESFGRTGILETLLGLLNSFI